MSLPGIIRNRMKIQAAVTKARAFRETQKECGSFSEFIYSTGQETVQPEKANEGEIE